LIQGLKENTDGRQVLKNNLESMPIMLKVMSVGWTMLKRQYCTLKTLMHVSRSGCVTQSSSSSEAQGESKSSPPSPSTSRRSSSRLSGESCELVDLEIAAAAVFHKRQVLEQFKASNVAQAAKLFEEEERALLSRLEIKLREYIEGLDPELGNLIQTRALNESKDGQPLWRYKKWAMRELARMKQKEKDAVKWERWLDQLEEARERISKYVLISDGDGNLMRANDLSTAQSDRYGAQLLAMVHVYDHLMTESNSGEMYTQTMAACEVAAWAVRVHRETVRKWKREFELHDGLFTVSQYCTYVRGWVLDDKVRRDRVRR
jgi:hypothetical protein